MASSVAPPQVVSIADFRPLARRRLPRAVFDYVDGGADAEMTLRENCRAFAARVNRFGDLPRAADLVIENARAGLKRAS